MIRAIESSAAEPRLAEARAFVRARLGAGDILVVGASRGAVDDLARTVAREAGATLGLHRFSLTQLAGRLAAPHLAADRLAPSTTLGVEALAARAVFEVAREAGLAHFGPVASTPGFPRALARTLLELRLAQVRAPELATLPLGGRDLSALLDEFERQFVLASAADRATLFAAATSAVPTAFTRHLPLLLLDVPLTTSIEFALVRVLVENAGDVLLTVPFGDLQALDHLATIGIVPEVFEPRGDSDLDALRRYLFARSRPPEREKGGDVRFFSAPGEARECVEIARRVLDEARRGVPFDEIAVFLRAPQRYAGLLEHAFKRACHADDAGSPERGIPAWFDRGTRRPHPGGRAFLAMLACACEKLSARRFAEYLSLAQVPQPGRGAHETFVAPADEVLGPLDDIVARGEAAEDADGVRLKADTTDDGDGVRLKADTTHDGDGVRLKADTTHDSAVVEGTLRAPWKWETLIVESSVIGGDPGRWRRRLDGLEHEYRVRIEEEAREDPGSARVQRLTRDLRDLGHLRAFALPIVERLASWPQEARWGAWLERFTELAPLVLGQPDRVLRVLAELRPMAEIGPVSLAEARDVVAERLLTLEVESPRHRYGRVFVGSPEQARGRTFRVVFVAGLAERLFPQKPHEDPMLLDKEMRAPLGAGLAIQDDRGKVERLLLRLPVGAATERVWLSYPRIEIAESRPRVPSFYALDVMRAMTGRIPDHEALQDRAAAEGGASLAWPAPVDPATAIDDLEHDLAVLRELLTDPVPARVRGQAHYLLKLNDALRRSVTARWARGRPSWTPFDGITRVTGATRPLLDAQRLGARPYSLSALQKFATCPYQFLLSAMLRLQPAEDPEPLQKLDPLTRGALFHEVQATFLRQLQRDGRLPVTTGTLSAALATLDQTVAHVADEYRERLAPAIERVWRDEIAGIAKDLRVWAQRLPEAAGWLPEYFEFSFGLSGEGRDPRSIPAPVTVGGRFMLRGSVDLIERKTGSATLRVTDHKTGKNRTTAKTVIGGGAILQPVLYSLAVEQALDVPVEAGRLFYCTAAGGFTDHAIPITDATRRAGLEALEIVDRAIELGFLPAAPAQRGCDWCDFRPVCGPHEARRVKNKPQDKLGDLEALREKP